ncbi:hypothetical protein BCIN_12g04360 [Botrytis cinerea B05.10]|uniref:CCHC-type domain-containing protein n=1 Tax=Botryotinia fuckeliana (strain B05.10) TaxID=332648 RepID=A0A384JZ48_BOTFB|nr:hypothetical protein BCIN_12g04360 [Botrytis cinerea B05.10]ATZ55886.1 hypothetical protein BCIN_12g04360 [Botrytis cinerea B05.10]
MGDSNHCELDDVAGWKQKFENWSQNLHETEHLMSSSANMNYTHSSSNRAAVTPTPSDPMDLDAFKTQNRDQQREEERRLGLCHYCKKPGHSVWDCNAKKQADSQRVSRGSNRGSVGGRGAYRGAPGRASQYSGNRNSSYNRNDFQEYGSGNNYNNNGQASLYPRQHLNALQGFVEDEYLVPSESASNTPSRDTSISSINDYKGKVQSPH